MSKPLGYVLMDWLGLIFGASFCLGWILVLLKVLIENLFPNFNQKHENFINNIVKYLEPVIKYSLIGFLVFLAIEFLAKLLFS